MPTYEYVCDKCKHQFELVQSINDDALTVCPREHCGQKTWGKGKVKRLIVAGGGLIFKGSGFYITDYRSKEYKESARKDTAPSPAPGSSETKPAASTKPKPESKPVKKDAA
jgi:putative FmdB family regulatory protein